MTHLYRCMYLCFAAFFLYRCQRSMPLFQYVAYFFKVPVVGSLGDSEQVAE